MKTLQFVLQPSSKHSLVRVPQRRHLGMQAGFVVIGSLLFLILQMCRPAYAVNKCTVNNKTVYQDTPCEQNLPTVAHELKKKQNNELLHQLLDRRLASGTGVNSRSTHDKALKNTTPATRQTSSAIEENDLFQPQQRGSAQRAATQANAKHIARQDALEQNARAAARLQKDYDDMLLACKGKTFQQPVIGMTDEQFRMCTLPNRLGAIDRVVVAEENGLQLRLYISPTQPATRVYTIDGVVTSIKP